MKVQAIFTAAKLIALTAIIIAGIAVLSSADANNWDNAFYGDYSLGSISLALYSGLFAYGGWNYLNFVTEELKDPNRNLHRAIMIALPLVTVIYVLTNIAYLSVLSPGEIISSSVVAVSFGKKVLGPLQYFVPVFVALSTFGSLNGILFTSGRLFLAGARVGHLPPVLSFIHITKSTPVPALMFTCLLSLCMLIADIIFLINYLSFVLWLNIGLAGASLLWLRKTRPDLKPHTTVNLAVPIVFMACCTFLVVVPLITDPKSTGLGILLTLSGVPFYIVGVVWKKKPKLIQDMYRRFVFIIQKSLHVVYPEPYDNSSELLLSTDNQN